MTSFPRGSEWRKWDLHVHAPGTKLSDGYHRSGGALDIDRFCRTAHSSDVAVLAIADYFSFDSYFAVKARYDALVPENERKLLLPNLELRLPLAVNRDHQEVNLHLIFRPSLSPHEASTFLSYLKTAATEGPSLRTVRCADLSSPEEFESATVSLDAIDEAIRATFGEHAPVPSIRQEHLLVVASAKGDGIRPGGSGIQRKKLLTDEIDKRADAFFANAGSRAHFLNTERLETAEVIAPKPVFDGCDAHSFEDLESSLGKQVRDGGRHRNITWIKADPTYAGLLQTLVEPAERVAMQAAAPDPKEPYKVISHVTFEGTEVFPEKVVFNPNLNSVIGSRSSGKSALLAFIAHSVDPLETVRIQTETTGLKDEGQAGPAAGLSWEDVADVRCTVHWTSGEGTSGKVIYIPQNSLYALSEQPEEITKKIAPALFRSAPSVGVAFETANARASAANADIRTAVAEWFDLAQRVDDISNQIRDLGDKAAVEAERDRLQAEVDRIKRAAQLTDGEVAEYQRVEQAIDSQEARIEEIGIELEQLGEYVEMADGSGTATPRPGAVHATISLHPTEVEVPEAVASQIEAIIRDSTTAAIKAVEAALSAEALRLDAERSTARADLGQLRSQNAVLIAKHEANEELRVVVADHKKQVASLEEIGRREKARGKARAAQRAAAAKAADAVRDREAAFASLVETFSSETRVLTDLTFGIEVGVTPEVAEHASIGLSQRSTNDYIKSKGDAVAYLDAQSDPATFLDALRRGSVTLNRRFETSAVAADVLTVTPEVRFTAELDGDRIGGFGRSSMTPGKQALFALTLILNESQEPWPLLIDQPEDDLDSRSIYDAIVPYLTKRKKERQIIMASHNANLVIGADSELVVVANRHGEDRRNRDDRYFEYFTGSLEHSQPFDASSPTTLGRCGIREHACEILDGGEEAFMKRREKYKLRSSR